MLALAEAQQQAVEHDDGPLLLLGAAGTGKTEALARRFARLVGDGIDPERILLLTSNQPTANRLRQRVEALLDDSCDELWIDTWEALGERLLREHSTAAGLDPFFDVLGPAERLAVLLDRIEDLPLRNREIRGNATGLLARLLDQIDDLKTGSEPPEPELAEFCAAHDRILAESGNLDRGDVFLTLNKLLHERLDICANLATRFIHLMVDEYEDTTSAQRVILTMLRAENSNHLYAEDPSTAGPVAGEGGALRADAQRPSSTPPTPTPPAEETLVLKEVFRQPAVRRWSCTNERAQAQAVTREVEHLLAEGASPDDICVLVDDPATQGGAVSAAMEEREIPFHLVGPAALFHRPEVRDAIAWLRALADPEDSAAVARALTRPPTELRSADLARLTTIARRRKVDMVSACEAAL
ncbi:MAG TPA: UvrD-helicase domain-containing protein [Solirubrobacterales bacterium]